MSNTTAAAPLQRSYGTLLSPKTSIKKNQRRLRYCSYLLEVFLDLYFQTVPIIFAPQIGKLFFLKWVSL